MTTALIVHIVRASLHDGSGLRTVVYFKGCPLRCQWCHNPESNRPEPEILYMPQRCVGCGRCTALCPDHHMAFNGKIRYDREGCARCTRCAEACPSGALAACGEPMTVDGIFHEVIKDKDYYDKTSGGVTLSGGECLLYPEFCAQLLDKCKKAGIHTAVESSLHVPWDHIESILPVVDAFFIDIKIADPSKHMKYTGSDNALIIKNLRALADIHPNICVRLPLVPGVTDGENTAQTAAIINTMGAGVRAVELLRYNNMARGKYIALGLPQNPMFDLMPQDEAAMHDIRRNMEAALNRGINLRIH